MTDRFGQKQVSPTMEGDKVVDLSEYVPWEPTIDEEELRRREQSEEWYTTQEVFAHLKKLGNP